MSKWLCTILTDNIEARKALLSMTTSCSTMCLVFLPFLRLILVMLLRNAELLDSLFKTVLSMFIMQIENFMYADNNG